MDGVGTPAARSYVACRDPGLRSEGGFPLARRPRDPAGGLCRGDRSGAGRWALYDQRPFRSLHLLPGNADPRPARRRCREALERLASETHATAQLCALRGNKYVVVDVRDGTGVFKITTDIGVEVPIPWTASGRLLLDHLSPAEILAFVPKADFRLPDGRAIEPQAFVAEIARARADGRCMTNGLSDRFTCCLAAPIRDRRGIAVATLCFIVPVDSSDGRKRELLDRLVAAAAELSDR